MTRTPIGGPARRFGALLGALLVLLLVSPASAQTPDDILYILPIWTLPASDAELATHVARLRTEIGEGKYVRVGFAVYIRISMTNWSVNVADRAAVRQALAGTINDINTAVDRARQHGIPIGLSFLTAIRESYDPAQSASEIEDRRNMQWYGDNALANGWWSHTRYARKVRRVQEAYIRELGAVVADLMRRYPETLVAATGDGEVELSYDRSPQYRPELTPQTASFADYSPFAVREFGDWLRAAGLYAPGQPLAGQAYSGAARYAGDLSPNADTNHDGHTLDGDFGLGLTSWALRFGDWNLGDSVDADPRAIPASTYTTAGWSLPDTGAARFDAPRVRNLGNPWWELWMEFRQNMIWRHNLDFARWMTTSPDATGATISPSRWYADQIPADYLFGHSPANKDFRLESSASPWWTADVAPYGSVGITSFNVNFGGSTVDSFARTLVNVVPQIAARNRRWGIIEWNPSAPASSSPAIYDAEMALIEQYRPSLLIPFHWGPGQMGMDGTPFIPALKRVVDRIKDGKPSDPRVTIDSPIAGAVVTQPFTLSGWAVDLGKIRGPGRGGGVDAVQVFAFPNPGSGQPPLFLGNARYGIARADVGALFGAQFASSGFNVRLSGLTPGRYRIAVYARSTVSGTFNVSKDVDVTLTLNTTGGTAPPFGVVDTPANGATGLTGSIGVTGWALDDLGVVNVKIYRNCLTGIDNPASCQTVGGSNVVFVGDAAFLAGARPDVEAFFPSLPNAGRAGWGYLLLTNMLPHVPKGSPSGGGQGTMTLFAFATDVEGHRVLLGQKAMTLDNDHASRPFGAIDTPSQGGAVSGAFPNFGWALTPGTATIPIDGSTMNVVVDGVAVGKVAYNQCRAGATNLPPAGTCHDDIATLFPASTNVLTGSGAIGSFILDTRTMANGLHTIAWGVVDNQGRNDGIGSRFFSVLNGTSAAVTTEARTSHDISWRSVDAGEVSGRTEFDFAAPFEAIATDGSGARHVRIPEFGRLELQLGAGTDGGYLQANGTLRPLPPGSHLDTATGRFTWAPGPGYIGTYELVFLQETTRTQVAVTIRPRAAVTAGMIRASVDLPIANARVSGTFTVAGWALDLGAWHGAGIDAVHVWAQRRDEPAAHAVFLGAADLGGVRPDVAAAFGSQFDHVGWGTTVAGLAPGTYEVTAYFRSARTRRFEDARTMTVTVR